LSYRPDLGRAASDKAQNAHGGNHRLAASALLALLEHDASGPDGGGREANGGPRNSLQQFLAKIRIPAICFPTRRIEPGSREAAGEARGDRNFFYFFRRNPLKSPDSDE